MKLSTLIVIVPVAVLAAIFAVLNRQEVVVALGPFAPNNQPLTFAMPLYLLVFIVLMAGVLLGGATVALNRGRARQKRLKATEIGDAIVKLDRDKAVEETAA
jgi:uncharacterized integral membrane protein